MTLRSILRCIRHVRTWRQCLYDEVKQEPIVGEWRAQRHAAIESTRAILRETREASGDPLTAAIRGEARPHRQRGGTS